MDSKKITYGQLKIVPINTSQVDIAWSKGASELEDACKVSVDYVSIDVLKSMLLRGDALLYCILEIMENGGQEPRGWFVAMISRYPTFNAFVIYAAVGSGCTKPEIMQQAKELATQAGCSAIECSTSVEKLINRYKDLGLTQVSIKLRMEI